MKYIKVFESWYMFKRNIEEWDKSKHFLDKDVVKTIDDDTDEVKALMTKITNLEWELEGVKREFYSRDRKLLLSIKKARGNIGATIKVGQKLYISKIFNFNYTERYDSETKKTRYVENAPHNKRYYLYSYGLDYQAYSDIEVTDISKSGKTVSIEFEGHKGYDETIAKWIDGTRIPVDRTKVIKLKMRMGTFKSFYFNLMNSNDYREVISGESLKKINRS